jgi:hypothetical protein
LQAPVPEDGAWPLNGLRNPNLRLVTPTTEDRTVTPRRAPNAQLRTREHLPVRQNRYGHRDALMVLVAYRHGF